MPPGMTGAGSAPGSGNGPTGGIGSAGIPGGGYGEWTRRDQLLQANQN